MDMGRQKENSSVQGFPIGPDQFLVPVEGVLPVPFHGSASVVVLIHIDESIALAQFPCAGGNQVRAAPHGVSHEIHVVDLHGVLHGGQMHLMLEHLPHKVIDAQTKDIDPAGLKKQSRRLLVSFFASKHHTDTVFRPPHGAPQWSCQCRSLWPAPPILLPALYLDISV